MERMTWIDLIWLRFLLRGVFGTLGFSGQEEEEQVEGGECEGEFGERERELFDLGRGNVDRAVWGTACRKSFGGPKSLSRGQ